MFYLSILSPFAEDKIRLLGFTTLHDTRRYAIPQCWAPHTQTQWHGVYLIFRRTRHGITDQPDCHDDPQVDERGSDHGGQGPRIERPLAHGARLPDQTPASPCPPRPRPRPPPARHPRAVPCHTIVPSLHVSRDGVAGACRRFGRLDTYRVVGIAAIADCHQGVLDSLVGCKVSQTRKQVRPPSPHRPNTHTLFVSRHQFHLPLLSHRFLDSDHLIHHMASPHRSSTCAGNLLDLPA